MKRNHLSRRARHGAASWLLVALASVVGSPAIAQSSGKAAQYYEDALARHKKKDLKGAIIQLKNALQIDNNMLPVQLLLGRVLMETGEIPAAEVALKEALNLGVNRAEVVLLLAKAYAVLGKQRALLEETVFNPAGLPRDVQVPLLLVRAGAYADTRNLRDAYRSIDEARAINSGIADVWLAEVPLRVRSGQFKEAAAAADRALAVEAASAEAWYQKGSVQHMRGDLAGALSSYDKALQRDAKHVEARVSQIGIYLDQARLTDATKSIAELQSGSPRDPRGAYLKALLLERNGDPLASKAALKEVADLIDQIPLEYIRHRPQYLMLAGLAHFGLNQGEKAKQYLEEFRKVQNNTPTSKLLARIYMSDGNAAAAASVLEEYLRARPGDGQALILLASAHSAQGRKAKATALIQEALKTRDNPAFRTALGLSLVGEGKTFDGIGELEAAYKKAPQRSETAQALIQLYLRTGQAAKAKQLAATLVKQQPTNASFQNLLGMSLRLTGDANGAKAAYDRSLQLDGTLTAAALNMARLEISQKALDSAAKRLNGLLEREPANSEAMFELAMIAERRGTLTEAEKWIQKARDVAPAKDLRWGIALVDFELRNGRNEQALDAAKVASGKAPEDVATLLAYSRAQLAMGDTFAAKSTLTNVTRFADYNPPLQLEIASLQMAANNAAGAAYSLEKALATRPDFLPAQALMVEVEMRQGEIAKAQKRARDIVASNPRRAIGYSLQGDIELAKGQRAAAVDAFRRAHQIEPTTFSLLRLFGALAVQDGGKPAIQLAEEWIKSHPEDHPVRKALGDAYARAGNFTRARTVYEAADKRNPDDAELLNNLANVQLRLKDHTAAIKTAERALAVMPKNALVADTLAWALFQAGQVDRSLQLLRDARLRQPGNPEIRYHLAAVLAQMGRKTEAKTELEPALHVQQGTFESVAEAQKLMQTLR